MKVLRLILVLLPLFCDLVRADLPAGRVVWWGMDFVRHSTYSGHTNGAVTSGNETLSNVVSIAAHASQGLALKSDGTVFAFGSSFYGGNDVPASLSNVVSIAVEGSSCWAIRRDGTVARWGNGNSDQDDTNIVGGLSNITAITWAGYGSYLALKNDGTALAFRFDTPDMRTVGVRGQVLSNVVAFASMGEFSLALKGDGTVVRLKFSPVDPVSDHPMLLLQSLSAEAVIVDGQALSNVVAFASGGGHALALRSNGTVVAWGGNYYGETAVPAGLSHVIAIAADEHLSLALKRDGTVVAWGGNYFGQTSVPAGLSNVVAIAAGGWFSLALTTGNVPSSVFIEPHGRLEEMAAESALVFKGQVLSSARITNSAFHNPQMDVHATRLKVISVLKGEAPSPTVIFQHYTTGPGTWRGRFPPAHYRFEVGQSYLVFAASMDKPDTYYSSVLGTTNKPDEFRQIAGSPTKDDEGVIRTLDARPLGRLSIKDAHWLELHWLLNDTNPTNQLYAIQHLDWMSKTCGESWGHSDDFRRERVLTTLRPLLTNSNERVALAALSCFQVGSECATQIAPHATALLEVAAIAPSIPRRVAAIAAFSGTKLPGLANSLPKWLSDPAEEELSLIHI